MKQVKYLRIVVLAFTILTLATTSSFASISEKIKDYVKEFEVEASVFDRYFYNDDTTTSGNLNVTELEQDTIYRLNPNEAVSWELGFLSKTIFLDGDVSAIDLPATLVSRELRAASQFPVPFLGDDRYRIGLSVIPTYNTDSWGDSFGDFEYGAFRWVSEYWLEYRGDNKLYWQVGVRYKPEHDLPVVPVVGLNYDFNDDWSVRLTWDDFNIIYNLTDQIQLFTEHRYNLDEYEIESGGTEGRVLRHKQNTTGVGMHYNINDNFRLTTTVGGAYNRSFTFVDGNGSGKVALDESVYSTFMITAKF